MKVRINVASWARRLLLAALWPGCFAALVLLFSGQARSQILQGTIVGNVVDPSQAAIVGATVTAENQGTTFTRRTATNTAGGYTLATLPPGLYTITISARGFKSYIKTGIIVSANEVTRANATLTVGQITQSITVSAQASVLQTDRADVHTDLSLQTLNDLPVPLGRDYEQTLAVVTPGVGTPQSGQSYGANPSRAISISVNGVGANSSNWRIDGANATDYNANGKPMYVPALGAIANVSVVTNSFDAGQSMAGGAAVNVTTRSGTNAIHGSLFEYHTDQHLQAYPWAANRALAKPKYVNNQYGGTIGGPIKKNKMFYFVSFQGTAVSVENPVLSTVPTAAMKNGDLSGSPTPIYNPMTGNPNGTGRTAFPGNIIPQSQIDPGIAALLTSMGKDWPDPDQRGSGTLGLADNYLSSGDSEETQYQWDTKYNWNPSTKLSIFARFGLNDFPWFNPQQYGALGGPGMSPANTAVGTGGGFIYSGTLSGTYIFSPTLIADAYYGYSRNDAFSTQQELNENLGWTLLKIPGLQSSQIREGGLPALEIDDFGGTGSNIPEATIGPQNNFEPQYYFNREKEWAGNITWIKGTHNLRGGVDFDQQQEVEDFEEYTGCSFCTGSGGFEFSQGTTQLNGGPAGNDYNAFASFLLGLPSNAGKNSLIPPTYQTFANIFGVYARDQWQATRKLTLNYGTRWDYYPFPTRNTRGMEYLDAQTNQMVICGVGGNPRNCGITKDTHRFAPTAGVAYRLTKGTVIRAGYAISNDPENYGATLGNRQNFPDIVSSSLTAPNSFSYATTLRLGLPAVVAPNYSSGTVSVPTTASVWTVDQNYVRGYFQSWNLTVEQQFKGWLASAGYVATRAVDPGSLLDENWSPVGTGSAGEVLNVLAGRTAITDGIGTFGTDRYDSLQAQIQHRFAHNFEASATYTFARSLGNSSQEVVIPSDWSLNYGNVALLPRNTLGLTLVADGPFGTGQRWMNSGLGAAILGGWQLEATSVLRSGTPFTVTGESTTLNAIGSTQFGECISTPQEVGNIYEWYNPSAFAEPKVGTFGNCGYDTLWGPGNVTLDTALARTFVLGREFHLEFRAEMFNTANTPHHANPTSSITSSAFMEAVGIANIGLDGIDQRTAQLSLQLSW